MRKERGVFRFNYVLEISASVNIAGLEFKYPFGESPFPSLLWATNAGSSPSSDCEIEFAPWMAIRRNCLNGHNDMMQLRRDCVLIEQGSNEW